MTDDRSIERAARSWLEAGPTEAPPRAVEAALLRIETTPQERDLRIPWRFPTMTTPARVAAAAVLGVLLVGGAFFYFGQASQPVVGGPGPSATATAAPTIVPTPTPTPTPVPRIDYSDLPGQILIEHLGNAPDRSEADTTDMHTDRRRFYFMDAADMGTSSLREFLPGEPTGKTSADVSPDGRKVVFQDWKPNSRIWEANIDGTGLHQLESTCDCTEGDPAYDPTGTQIAFVRIEGQLSWLGIRDLTTGHVTKFDETVRPSADAFAEQPSWSPDGKKVVFSRLTWAGGDKPVLGTLSIIDVANGVVTDLLLPSLLPGEPDWSPNGSTIVFSSGPLSSTGGVEGLAHNVYSVRSDGTGLQQLTTDNGSGGASWTPDGQHILYFDNYFWLMNPDGSGKLPVNIRGMDLSDIAVGFGYIGHWVDNP